MKSAAGSADVAAHAPRVSVAIPTFNRVELLRRSVESTLRLTYPNLEIIISDNASSDATTEYLRALSDQRLIVLLSETNIGMAPNWDRCLAAATGEYFLLMSDDDAFVDPEAIAKMVAGFAPRDGRTPSVVFCDVLLERVQSGRTVPTTAKKTLYGAGEIIRLFFTNRITVMPCGTMVPAAELRRLGGYAGCGMRLAVDAFVWISIVLNGGWAARIAEPLVLYRVHDSLTSSAPEAWEADIEYLVQIFERGGGHLEDGERRIVLAALAAARNRAALGYVIRRWRHGDGPKAVLRAIVQYRTRLFKWSNVAFIATRILLHR